MKTYTYEEALQASEEYFGNDLSARAFVDKYALRNDKDELIELTPTDMHWRIAKELARVEKKKFKNPLSENQIFSLLDKFRSIIPQGSPMYGIGNPKPVSLSNCYVISPPTDSIGGIFHADQEMAHIFRRRGGNGTDISTLRPIGSLVNNAAKTSTGIPSWMERYSNTTREIGQGGRRAASMITLNMHHPDIIEFCTIKNDTTKVTGANISVKLTDEFFNALIKNKDYELRFPVNSDTPEISKMISAKKVWDIIINSAWSTAEPGLLMWDNILKESIPNNYPGFEDSSTNPCSEIPLCPYDSCRLLAINLFHAVKNPFHKNAEYDFDLLYETAQLAQRLMDDIVDLEIEAINKIIKKIENDPEPQYIKDIELTLWNKIRNKAEQGRRTGTGITALGDCMAALGIKYGSKESIEFTEKIYKTLKLGCYRSSVDIAKELGPFPVWDYDLEKDNPFLLRIKEDDEKLYNDMKKYGRRNIALLTTAPTGTVSMMAGLADGYHGTTSGIEPLFMEGYTRRKKGNPGDNNFRSDFVDQNGDHWMEFEVKHPGIDFAHSLGSSGKQYITADKINWINRVKLQGAAQKHIDHSISSTINLPNNVSKEEVGKIYLEAWKSGLKGITVYRDGCRTGVLVNKETQTNNAKKRPKTLKCDVHHFVTKGRPYCIVVGLDNEKPYEAFIIRNIDSEGEKLIPKTLSHATITKKGRSNYKLYWNNSEFNISRNSDEYEEMISRLTSMALRHNVEVGYVLHQLEKSKKDLYGLGQSIAKALKKYVADGTEIKGQECPECNAKLIRESGCVKCIQCSFTLC